MDLFLDKELLLPLLKMIRKFRLFLKVIFKFNLLLVDINIIFNYINTNITKLEESSFVEICLPGMTEEYKLHMFIHLDLTSNLKLIYVCEENSN